jgi:predicted transcriptional regulator
MPRTLISLDQDDQRWLDQYARSQNLSRTEVGRRALRQYREQHQMGERGFTEALERTKGTWPGEDPLDHLDRLRSEWDRQN